MVMPVRIGMMEMLGVQGCGLRATDVQVQSSRL